MTNNGVSPWAAIAEPQPAEVYAGIVSDFQQEPEAGPVFIPLNFSSLMALPEKVWLIDRVLGRGDLAMIFGESGSGKTFAVIDLIFAACTDQKWADSFEIKRPFNVAYCAGEGVAGLKGRFAAQFNRRQADKEALDLRLSVYTTPPQLFESEVAGTIDRFIEERETPVDLLILDTLHAHSYGAEENSAKDTGLIIAAAKRAIAKLGCAVLLVHHANKAGGYRGSSALHGACASIIEIKRLRDVGGFEMTCFKSKDSEPFSPVNFDLEYEFASDSAYPVWRTLKEKPDKAKTDTTKDKIMVFLSRYLETAFSARDVANALNISQSLANKWLVELYQEGKVSQSLKDITKPPSNWNPMVYCLMRDVPEKLEY